MCVGRVLVEEVSICKGPGVGASLAHLRSGRTCGLGVRIIGCGVYGEGEVGRAVQSRLRHLDGTLRASGI